MGGMLNNECTVIATLADFALPHDIEVFITSKNNIHCKKLFCTPIHYTTRIVVCTNKVITSIQMSSLKTFSVVGNQFCTFKETWQCKTEFEMYFIALPMFILQNLCSFSLCIAQFVIITIVIIHLTLKLMHLLYFVRPIFCTM